MTTDYETSPPVYTRTGERHSANAVADALRTHETFTRGQVAWLMSAAFRWGYELRTDQARDDYTAGWNDHETDERLRAEAALASFTAKDVSDGLARKWLREQRDLADRTPRPGDHPGGPVVWGEEPTPLSRHQPELRVAA